MAEKLNSNSMLLSGGIEYELITIKIKNMKASVVSVNVVVYDRLTNLELNTANFICLRRRGRVDTTEIESYMAKRIVESASRITGVSENVISKLVCEGYVNIHKDLKFECSVRVSDNGIKRAVAKIYG